MKAFFNKYLRSLFFGRRLYIALVCIAFVSVLGFWFSWLYMVAQAAFYFLLVLLVLDYIVLFRKTGITVQREAPDRFSNGDENKVRLILNNHYSFTANATIIDEVPVQFQHRDFKLNCTLRSGEEIIAEYKLRPVERGEYVFQDIHIFTKTPLRLVVRRITRPALQSVKVLPSFLTLRHYEIKAHASQLAEAGNKRVRKLGNSLEFEQIKEYVRGDDIRTMHWKATARKGQLMVNNYTDERSQQIYCVIDKGRVMKMPFEGMSLLDYAINATLIVSRVALIKQDKAGIVTFSEQVGNILPADRKAGQMNSILQTLYSQQTRFMESDYEKLYTLMRTRITQRGLVILFTNFESMSGLERQLPYIRSIAQHHLVLVVFFENTELKQLTESRVTNVEELYIRTIAEKFAHEKRLIIKELQKHGILAILTTPQKLTIDTVNKYLELKARHAI
ncbi:MAG TPA: DUF58 domain-containing protein [Chitinophagaceae bacterium]|nr:DUF58 domain-containing protein [Chitinophagaceae bacterium]